MIISIIGPSGSGKDTQASYLEEKYNIPNISTGRIMREEIAAGTELGKRIDQYISGGNWLPDDMTYQLLLKRVQEEDAKQGFILNGFPRTYEQITYLDRISDMVGNKLVAVIHFVLDDEEIIRRMHGQTKEAENRSDMSEEAIMKRLQTYKDTINPILTEYKKRNLLIDIDANPSIPEVSKSIEEALSKVR